MTGFLGLVATAGALADTAKSPLVPRKAVEGLRFTLLPPDETGLDFTYRWQPPEKYEHELVNAVTGGGVCLGDIDKDGLTDVFLTQPFLGNRLYRNLGGFKFEDITESAGLTKEHLWGTGATFADIDNDGDLDLFVCGYDCESRLYLNDGTGRFVEGAEKAGLAYRGAAVMMAFADYDRDGDLDAYLCNNHIAPQVPPLWRYEKDASGRPILPDSLKGIAKPLYRPDIRDGKLIPAGESDRLYRNNGDGTFTDVSAEVGIHDEDFGLSVTWWDFDHDGWPDIYNANDFYGADHLYRNNGDGTFTNVNKYALPHTPWFSMGTDVADVNNDGLLDLMASDMQGSTHYKQKLSMGDMQGWFLETAVPRQYMRNALYINTGLMRFQEAAFMAGVDATDWTWSLKFGDLDSDGWTDLFVTNGAERYWDHSDMMAEARGTQRIDTPELKKIWLPSPVRNDPNMAFRNKGDLEFDDVGGAWGLDAQVVSYGAVLGDLDGDGDLDIITNNFDGPAHIYRNNSSEHRLALLSFHAQQSNREGIGAIVRIKTAATTQTHYLTLARGFMSANDAVISAGLGEATVFAVEIDWPSGLRQVVKNLQPGHHYRIRESGTEEGPVPEPEATQFALSPALKDAVHVERPYDDFAREPLLPNRLSQLGPGMAWGDVDGDGDDDLYVGGAAGQAGRLFLTREVGFHASPMTAFVADAECEDMGACFLDADGDGDLDLFVVSGGVEAAIGSEAYRDRLYWNDGNGAFTRAPKNEALPDRRESGGCVAAADFDRDGDVDLFVGGRVVPGKYPETPRSLLLLNEGGKFVEAAEATAAGLSHVGLVTSALWSDADNDGWLDLLITREWESVAFFRNEEGRLIDATQNAGLSALKGWWNGIDGTDIDHDGDMDYVVTNFGLNTKYTASPKEPARIYYGDMDGSGNSQLVEAKVKGDEWLPIRGKSCSQRAMPVLEKRFPTFQSFASATLPEIYTDVVLESARVFDATELRSGVLRNEGNGTFTFEPLPRMAQIAPAFGASMADFDGDSHADLCLAQNFFGPQAETGRMDGGVSLHLLGEGSGLFRPVATRESGIMVPGDATGLATVDLNRDGWPDVVIASNNGPVFIYINRGSETNRPLSLRFEGPPGNPTAAGTRVTLRLKHGQSQTSEVHAGNGYLTQNPGMLFFGVPHGDEPLRLEVRWADGKESRLDLTGIDGKRLLIRHAD